MRRRHCMYQMSASSTSMLIGINMETAFIPPLKGVGFRLIFL